MYNFLYVLNIYFVYLQSRVMEKEWERQKFICWFTPRCRSSWCWARIKPQARNLLYCGVSCFRISLNLFSFGKSCWTWLSLSWDWCLGLMHSLYFKPYSGYALCRSNEMLCPLMCLKGWMLDTHVKIWLLTLTWRVSSSPHYAKMGWWQSFCGE